MAVRSSIAEHNCAVCALRSNLKEVWHELRVLSQINATKVGYAAPSMSMDVKQRDTGLHTPLHCVANRVGTHHCADGGILKVFIVVHGPILTREHQ